MKIKTRLSLLSVSGWVLATLLGTTIAEAVEIDSAVQQGAVAPASCDAPPLSLRPSLHGGRRILVASATGVGSEDTFLDFTDAESDAAATLFGCDCPACIRSLRQLQSQPLAQQVGNKPQGHCLTALQRRNSPQVIQEVLQNLAAEQRQN